MRRRGFIAAVAAITAWPVFGHAQQTERVRRVGVLTALPKDISEAMVGAFARSLESLGWDEGKNIRIDHRSVAGDATLLALWHAAG
jgi:putative tryptophan/tyrosine transport system substrate-binding protein